ncbi:MAG: MotA/TolQ/ExbB proton channel family protein [uncultured Thiotrichaceae bacterium]|uniref:Tol-Pal system protein TolQ n=1 Tax=uncultured Thiotrichaceae bacterium TaxID=298394 RepID=A0A6S6U9C2_9GAMM|nr:MAG: MotA/TolQ/ExbB proton channel family protein [uncultured Thiotrichaceae bacterium]
MQTDFSILKLIIDASPVVQVVMALLVLASIASWAVMIIKYQQLKSATIHTKRFEDRFWSGISLKSLHDNMKNHRPHTGIDRIFFDGYEEFTRSLTRHKKVDGGVLDSAHRAMRIAESRELDKYEQNLTFLATVASTSPYVGLFGTVWGIMSSFLSIAHMKQATLAVVAPGIAEALIATALGLFAAIPALIAYNKFSDSVDRLSVAYENFREEFVSLLSRHSSKSE